MEDFNINIIDDIAVVMVDILVATHRDAKPLWDKLEGKSILDWDKIIIDISNCTFIDSTFLGMIIKIHKRVSENSGKVKLVFPEKSAMVHFHSFVTSILDCFNTLNQALYSFGSEIHTRKIAFSEELV